MTEKGGKVFLSYARSDRDAAQKVGRKLQEAGFDVWDPAEQILPGGDWGIELKTALDSAGAIVVYFPRSDDFALRFLRNRVLIGGQASSGPADSRHDPAHKKRSLDP